MAGIFAEVYLPKRGKTPIHDVENHDSRWTGGALAVPQQDPLDLERYFQVPRILLQHAVEESRPLCYNISGCEGCVDSDSSCSMFGRQCSG